MHDQADDVDDMIDSYKIEQNASWNNGDEISHPWDLQRQLQCPQRRDSALVYSFCHVWLEMYMTKLGILLELVRGNIESGGFPSSLPGHRMRCDWLWGLVLALVLGSGHV